MFKDTEKTKVMIQGAYRKLKSYYYYNKNFMIMREKISSFEDDRDAMYATFEKLAETLCHPIKMREYIDELIAQIDFYAIPKKFESDTITNNSIISNTISRDKKMKSVNFFINAPIELHILDTLWTVFLAKMDYDKKYCPIVSMETQLTNPHCLQMMKLILKTEICLTYTLTNTRHGETMRLKH